MDNEWRYLVNTRDCYINLLGEVTQDGRELVPYTRAQSHRHRWVDLDIQTNHYDYETGEWGAAIEPTLVWQLMISAWFSKWPSDGELFFVDDNPWNCHADNIRSWSRRMQRVIEVRDDGYAFTFDKRLRGRVEVVETGRIFEGPSDAAKSVGGTRSGVSLVLSGRLTTHKGYHFKWV